MKRYVWVLWTSPDGGGGGSEELIANHPLDGGASLALVEQDRLRRKSPSDRARGCKCQSRRSDGADSARATKTRLFVSMLIMSEEARSARPQVIEIECRCMNARTALQGHDREPPGNLSGYGVNQALADLVETLAVGAEKLFFGPLRHQRQTKKQELTGCSEEHKGQFRDYFNSHAIYQ